MPQPATTQDQANAQVWSQAISDLADNFANMWKLKMQQNTEQKKIDLQSLDKVKTFMSLPPEKRQVMLKDPNFVNDMIRTVDPESFATKGKTKKATGDAEGMATRTASVMALGNETTDERMKREEQSAKTSQEQSKAQMEVLKKNLATGVTTPTPMNLLGAFDVKDPFAGQLFSSMSSDPQIKDLVTNLALFEKKGGPLYQQQQQMDWYKWGINQGFSPALAMNTASSISKGEWDKVPQTYTSLSDGKTYQVRGKAEQQLAIDTANAASRAQEVQNNLESSVVTSSTALAEKAGIPLDHARADVVAMRAGKPIPFTTPALEEHVANDKIIQGQEIEKNKNLLLNDKYGITQLQGALTTLIQAQKEQGGANAKDTQEKVDTMVQDLSSRLASRYGVKFDEYSSWGQTVKAAFGDVWRSAATTGAYAADQMKTIGAAIQAGEEPPKNPSSTRGEYERGVFKPTEHTPEQLQTLQDLYGKIGQALTSDDVSPDKKKQYQTWMQDVLEPAYNDPSKFNDIFTSPLPQ